MQTIEAHLSKRQNEIAAVFASTSRFNDEFQSGAGNAAPNAANMRLMPIPGCSCFTYAYTSAIARNSLGLRLAPPTSAPSTLSTDISSLAFDGFTEPP